ncbi:MAG: putative invasin [Firmicutes bacterium]|nr:putative invasin [Bacillota bacterium]
MFLAKQVLKFVSNNKLLFSILLLFTTYCITNVHEQNAEDQTVVPTNATVITGDNETMDNQPRVAPVNEESTVATINLSVKTIAKPVTENNVIIAAQTEYLTAAIKVDKPLVGASAATVNTDIYQDQTNKEKALTLTNTILANYIAKEKKNGPKWLQTTDINLKISNDNQPLYSTETLQPFRNATKNNQVWFWQGRYDRSSDTENTTNMGLGWRKLSKDKTKMVGLNAFYDYTFQYDLARLGVGAEFVGKIAEYRVNWYHPIFGENETASTLQSDDSIEAVKGYKVLSKIKLTPRVNVEVGYRNSNLQHGTYGMLTYQLGKVVGGGMLSGPAQAPKHTEIDLTSYLTKKVERENTVTTQTMTVSP